MKKVYYLLFFILIISFSNSSFSQRFINNTDISKVVVKDLSQNDIMMIIQEMNSNNLSINQVQSDLKKNGMAADEIELLVARIQTNLENSSQDKKSRDKKEIVDFDKKEAGITTSEVFGSEFFNNSLNNYSPRNNLPSPSNYVLGFGDKLLIELYGTQIASNDVSIDRNGEIQVPYVGTIKISSLTLEEAKKLIRSKFAYVYRSLNSGGSSLSISITDFKTINVSIQGAKKSGNFNVSSFTTIFDLIYQCGGPNEYGTYRNVQLIRDNKIYKSLDLYSFFVSGILENNINLRENDIVKIPSFSSRIKIQGQVKREGVFELKEKENFSDLLLFCSGFTDSAIVSKIKIKFVADDHYQLKNVLAEDFESYFPKSGDLISVSTLINKIYNSVSLSGAVYKPDSYELTEGMTLSKLIEMGKIKEEAFIDNIQIIRKKEDNSNEFLQLNYKKILSKEEFDFVLKSDDQIHVFSLFDLKENLTVSTQGQLNNPGTFSFAVGMSLYDVILKSDGILESASNIIEISRMIKSNSKENLGNFSKIIVLKLDEMYNDTLKSIKLEPFDIVKIRKKPVYEPHKEVFVKGEVVYSGKYTLKNASETVFDILSRAGGVKPEANIEAVFIRRKVYATSEEDTTNAFVIIPVNYKKALRNHESNANIKLQIGDIVEVCKNDNLVKIVGAVNLKTEIAFEKGKNLKYYVRESGGFNQEKSKKDIYIIYANGRANHTKNFLFFKVYPKVRNGSKIIVPPKVSREKRMTTVETIAISSVIGSFTGLVISVINSAK